MKSKLFCLLLATTLSCSGTKDPIKSNNSSKAANEAKKRAEELGKLEEIVEKAKETAERIAKEEKQRAKEEQKKKEEIAKFEREEAEERKKQEEKLAQEELEKKLKEEKELKKLEEIARKSEEEKQQQELEKEVKINLKDELTQKAASSLTSSEIDIKVTQAKQATQENENPFTAAIKGRKSLTLSQIEEKINANKQPLVQKHSMTESPKINSMLETVNNSLVKEAEQDLTESAIEREKREWEISSSTLNDSYRDNESLHHQTNNNNNALTPLNGQSFADLFKHTAQGSSLTASAFGKITGRRQNFSDSQMDDEEDLEASKENDLD